MPSRTFKDFQGFYDGVNSYLDPQYCRDTQARWAENAVCKGALWQTRPGLATRLSMQLIPGSPFYDWWTGAGEPDLHPQFFTLFQPTNGSTYAVFGVSGAVFYAESLPSGGFLTPQRIFGLQFDRFASQIAWAKTIKAADIVGGRVAPIKPRKVLMLQDGIGRAGYWDGVSAGHLNPQKLYTASPSGDTIFQNGYNQTRIGLWMAWSGNRLWVSNGSQVFASDQDDPIHFTEEAVFTNVPVFNFPDEITAVVDRGTSGVQQSRVFVFTAKSTFTLYSGLRDRTQWRTTTDFQVTVFSGTGCVAGKSPVNHLGLLYWYSAAGIVKLDSFGTVYSSQSLPPMDHEMTYSKRRMSPDRSIVAGGTRDSYLFWSVPVGPTQNGRCYNGQTQVLDRAAVPAGVDSTVATQSVPSWQGIWTGIRPVEWATESIAGQDRVYTLSMDYDGILRIWEAFQGNRADNGHEVPWTIETKTHPCTANPFVTNIFRHSRILLEQIVGNLSVKGFWRGLRGVYHQNMDATVTAVPGPILEPPNVAPVSPSGTPGGYGSQAIGISAPTFGFNTPGLNYSKQFRDIVSEDNRTPNGGTCQSTNVESKYNDSQDRAFSLLFKFRGVGALLAYRLAVDDSPNETEGAVVPKEQGLHILPEVGCPQFVDGPLPSFTLPESSPAEALVPYSPKFPEDEYHAPVAP
jgi:hypothetical protein